MKNRWKQTLTIVGAAASLAIVVSGCSSSAKITAQSAIDCSQSVKDRIAVVNAAAAKVDADQKALTKVTGGPGETPAKDKLKADTKAHDDLVKQNTACPSSSPSASASVTPAASAKVVNCDSADKQLADVQAKIVALQKTTSTNPSPSASASATASPTATATPSASPSASASATADPSKDMAKLQGQANELKAQIASAGCKSMSADQAITELIGQNGLFQGYQPGQVNVGSKNINWPAHQELRGIASFGTVTLKTSQEVGQYLSGSTAEEVTARDQVKQAITAAGYGQIEIDRALNGVGYFPVQPTVASQILGTSYFMNGKVYVEGTWRSVGPNDVYWVFMTVDHKIIPQATIRADCRNPHAVVITPIPPGTPPPPSVTKPPQSKNCMLNGSWTTGCAPNRADQPVQSNPGQPTGKTSGAPTSPPPYNPPATAPQYTPEPTGPGVNSGGGTGSAPGGKTCQQSGTCATGSPSPTTSPSPNLGNTGVTHSPAPSNSGMPSMPS